MIPIRDVIPSRTSPKVTIALLVVNVLAWLAMRTNVDQPLRLILTQGLVPHHFSWFQTILSVFVHIGYVHLISNMLALWLFGATLEDRLGHLRFLAFYVLAGVAGIVFAAWAGPDPTIPLIGASGSVAAVMSGYLALFPRSRMLVLVPLWTELDLVEVPAALIPALWLLAQALWCISWPDRLAIDPGMNVWATIGGAVTGAATVWLFRQPARFRVEWWGA
jgi:membrane associated rhomboid family serine protease